MKSLVLLKSRTTHININREMWMKLAKCENSCFVFTSLEGSRIWSPRFVPYIDFSIVLVKTWDCCIVIHMYIYRVIHLNRTSWIYRLFLMIQKNVSNESGTVSNGTYFSHVVFFLGGDAKKIRRSLSLF